jgi:hypothetical protein
MDIITGLFREIWHTFNEAAPYILFGTFMAGVIQIFVDKDKIARHLGKPGFKSVFLAALFGVPLPLCSCGVLPTAMSLRKNGASRGATLAFLISTPETGIDSIMLSFALLDPIMAVFRPVAAFITAVVAGIMENIFGHREKAPELPKEDKCPHCREAAGRSEAGAHSPNYGKRFIDGMEYAFVDLLGDIALWLALGIGIGGVISYFVPVSFIENYLGKNFSAMLIMLVIGIPLYICASASTPIASALIAKGMAPGTALVFLLAGPATNTAGIIAVGKFLGKRSVVIYLAAIAICAIGFGLLLNYIYDAMHINARALMGSGGHSMLTHHLGLIAAPVLIILMINAVFRRNKCAV